MRIKIIFYFFIIVLFSSCYNETKISHKNVFRYNESKGIASLDPAYAKSQVLIWPANQLYNGLVQMDNDLNILPCIAKKWVVLNSGITYKFTLRDDVYFHNHILFENGLGRKVTAKDFEYSLNRITNPKTASPGAWIFNNVAENGIKALNDSVVMIQLKSPFPAFLGLLTMQYCSVLPFEIVEHFGTDFRNNPVGTGPFQFKIWKENEKLVLVKNPNYFEKDSLGNNLPYLDAVSITFINDKQSEFLEFLKGNIDFISGLNATNKDELITKNGKLNPKYSNQIKMINQPYLNTEYLGFLLDTTKAITKSSPVLNKKIRQAINYGFDRQKMMKYLRNSIGTPAINGFIPKGLPSFSEEFVGYTYDPDKTRKLLIEAGFPNGVGLPSIVLTTTSDYLDLCEYIQQELAQFGIDISIDVSTGAIFRDMVANSKINFFRGSWIADYPDAENYLTLFYSKNFSPSGPNYTHYFNSEYDKLYKQAMLAVNDSVRYDIYNKMNRLIIDDAVIVPLYYDEVIRFVNFDIYGFESNPMNLLNLKQVKK
ncbi:MAG: ABC transporter substrate-binding protein [Bacteroidales bacterium]|jgi:ABC-type transport system substrate-binding protein|nr:ABC transporter substrate-binding protein [Bacteroidales bacterium]